MSSGIEDLLSRMLREELFVVTSTPIAGMESIRPHLRDHVLYMIELERTGILFASGPTLDSRGEVDGSGLTLLRCKTLHEAEVIARADPLVQRDLRRFDIRKWIMNEGSLSLSVRMSDATCRIG